MCLQLKIICNIDKGDRMNIIVALIDITLIIMVPEVSGHQVCINLCLVFSAFYAQIEPERQTDRWTGRQVYR